MLLGRHGSPKQKPKVNAEDLLFAQAASGVCHMCAPCSGSLGVALQRSSDCVVTVRPQCGALCKHLKVLDMLLADARKCQHRACVAAFRVLAEQRASSLLGNGSDEAVL